MSANKIIRTASLPCLECFTLSAVLEDGMIRCTDPLCGATRKA